MPIGISKKGSFPIDEADFIGKEDSFGSQGMPTVLWKGPYRFFFYSGDRNEPAHIHVEHENRVAKFWLDPVRLQNSGGFKRNELGRLCGLVEENQQQLLREWHEYFGG